MNPHQFHIEHARLLSQELDHAASRRQHDAPSGRRRIANPFAGRLHLGLGRVGTAPRTA